MSCRGGSGAGAQPRARPPSSALHDRHPGLGTRIAGKLAPVRPRPQGRTLLPAIALVASGLLLPPAARAQADEQAVHWRLDVEQLEWQDSTPAGATMWDLRLRAGTARNALWIRDEGGRHVSGAPRDNRLEVLWGHRPRGWGWMEALDLELLLGIRHDSGTTPTRTYGAFGLIAELPLGVRLEGTWYLGDGSREGDDLHSGVRVQLQRSFELGQRLLLVLRAEQEVWSEDHVRYTEGNGPWMWSAGARLHYRASERAAPYVGVEWFDLVGDTASLAIAAGESAREVRAVLGLRLAFGSR